MVDDTIHFEQKIFLREISNGLDLTNVRAWFQAVEPETGIQAPQPFESLSAFTRGTIEMIVGGYGSVPPTFRFDVDRIATLQMEFDLSRKQAACSQVFVNTLNRSGWSGLPPPQAYNSLLCRISAIAAYPRLSSDQPQAFREIALEIVRAAYELTGNTHLPEEVLLENTTNALLHRWNKKTTFFQELQNALHDKLIRLVDQEMAAVKDKTPLQILNYFNPTPANPPAINPYGTVRDMPDGQGSLQGVAKRIAHIATLHWRVWAPILYEQPHRVSASLQTQEMSADGEVDLAPTARMLMSEPESANNILKGKSVKSDESSPDGWQPSPV